MKRVLSDNPSSKSRSKLVGLAAGLPGAALLIPLLVAGFVYLAQEMLEGDLARLDEAILMFFRTVGNTADPVGPPWVEEFGRDVTTPGAGGSATPMIVEALAKGETVWAHAFEYACAQLGIEHRTTKPKHPWTNGQVERMNRTIKDATVKRYHYDDHDQLERHLADFVSAYNFGRRLKTLKGLTPYEFICKRWTVEPEKFRLNPLQQMPGLNI